MTATNGWSGVAAQHNPLLLAFGCYFEDEARMWGRWGGSRRFGRKLEAVLVVCFGSFIVGVVEVQRTLRAVLPPTFVGLDVFLFVVAMID